MDEYMEIQLTDKGGIIHYDALFRSEFSYWGRMHKLAIRRALGIRVIYIVRYDDEIIYIGSTNYDARSRIQLHLHDPKSKLGAFLNNCNLDMVTIETIRFDNSIDMREEELRLINQIKPKFNHDRSKI